MATSPTPFTANEGQRTQYRAPPTSFCTEMSDSPPDVETRFMDVDEPQEEERTEEEEGESKPLIISDDEDGQNEGDNCTT